MALYCAQLVEEGAQSAMIKSYISAVKCVLITDGYPWDDRKLQLSVITKACKIKNDKLLIRLPIQIKLLELIVFEIIRMHQGDSGGAPQPYLSTMYQALFLIAYYGLLRIGELTKSEHTIKVRNVHVGENKNKIMIVLYNSKTHSKESRPQKIKIQSVENYAKYKEFEASYRFFCPFKAMRKYISVRGNFEEDNDQFFIFRDRSPVVPHHVRAVLNKALTALNLDPEMYGMHSARIGRASDLFKFHYEISEIKFLGRWKSNAVYRYIKL